jgi:hypothetical protein
MICELTFLPQFLHMPIVVMVQFVHVTAPHILHV